MSAPSANYVSGFSPVQQTGSVRSETGETTMVQQEFLYKSNFQIVYQGTGVVRMPDAGTVAMSIVEFAKELYIPKVIEYYGGVSGDYKINEYGGPKDMGVSNMLASERRRLVKKAMEHECRETDRPYEHHGFDEGSEGIMRDSADGLVEMFRLGTVPEGSTKVYTSESRVEVNSKAIIAHYSEHCAGLEGVKIPFYKALNKALAEDDLVRLQALQPLMLDMNSYLNETCHKGGTVYSGVSIGPTTSALVKFGRLVRIPRFLSASANEKTAYDHANDLGEDIKAAVLKIEVPAGFWGARNIQDISNFPEEEETLFPAYSLFRVTRFNKKLEPMEIDLSALDKYFA